MKYKRLSASQSSHLCIQFTVLHKYIQRYGHHQNIGNTTTVRWERTQHDTATRKRDRMSELTVSPSHTHDTPIFTNFFYFSKIKKLLSISICTPLGRYCEFAHQNNYRTACIWARLRYDFSEPNADRSFHVGRKLVFFFFDWHTNVARDGSSFIAMLTLTITITLIHTHSFSAKCMTKSDTETEKIV